MRLQRILERPLATPLVIALAVLLCAPSLGNGLDLDDVLQAARLARTPDSWQLFALFGGLDPLVPDLDLPWWRHESMQLTLMRPLAALGIILDHRLFAGHPMWMHVHSLLCYALLLVVAARVYARLIPGRAAGVLALLLYAVDHSHGMVVGWIAARGSLVGAALALLALAAHDRWRRDGWRAGAVLGPMALLVALLANEGAVGVCGYLAAYALCLDRGAWSRRLVSLLPAAAVVLAWRACYVAAGFGAAHTGFYFDPGADPAGFLLRSLENSVILVWSQAFLSAGEVLGLFPGLYLIGALVAALLLVGVGLMFRRQLRHSAALRFWALGTLLCALPLGATLPTDRQLMLVGFGVFGFAAHLWLEATHTPMGRGVRWFCGGWFALHLILSPLLLPLRSLAPAQIHAVVQRVTIDAAMLAPARRVILLRAPSDLLMFYGRALAQLQGRGFPDQQSYLYAGLGALTVTRVDERTLELRPAQGWLYAPLDRLFRDADARFTAGQRLAAGTMQVEVREVTADGRPQVVRFQFDVSLADRGFAWFSWDADRPARIVLPAIGETLTLPAMRNPLLSP